MSAMKILSGGNLIRRATPANAVAILALAGTIAAAAVGASGAPLITFSKQPIYAGYMVSGQKFKAISASFTMPSFNCSSAAATNHVFYEIALGSKTTPLEEIYGGGSCKGSSPTYQAGYAFGQNAGTRLAVNVGDAINASVFYTARVNNYTFIVQDLTTGAALTAIKSCPASTSCDNSAAMVVAGPFGPGGSVGALTNYARVNFGNIAVTDSSGAAGGLVSSHWNTTEFVETAHYGGGTTFAMPSNADAGSAFNDKWIGAGPFASATVPGSPIALPAPSHRARSTKTSPHWTGYVATGNTFQSVQAQFTIPSVNCAGSTSYPHGTWSAFWVGIGGNPNPALGQDGVDARCTTSGAPRYFGWYEVVPDTLKQAIGFSVHPGDSITAVTSFDRKSRNYSFTLINNTTGQSFPKVVACPPKLSCDGSAEVISEAPQYHGVNLPLARYGLALYEGVLVTDTAGVTSGLTSSHWTTVGFEQKDESGHIVSTLDPLWNGHSFMTTWQRTQ